MIASLLKKAALFAAVLFALVAGIVIVRTALFTSTRLALPVPAPLAIDEAAAAERLGRAIRFRTVSHADEARMDAEAFRGLLRYYESAYPRLHARLTVENVARLSRLYTWRGTDPSAQPILLMAHIDVVPVENEGAWKVPPFSGIVSEGFVWGRGAIDDKGNAGAILEAVETLVARGLSPRPTVYIALSHNEEPRGDASAQIAAILERRGVRLSFVLDEGGIVADGVVKGVARPVALIGIAEKGYVSLALTTTSVSGHSSMPPRETAVGRLCRAVARLEAAPFPLALDGPTRHMLEYIGPEMGLGSRMALANLWLLSPLVKAQLAATPSVAASLRTTTAPTMLAGSPQDNVLPMNARAVVNFRIRPGETVASVTERVRRTIDDPGVDIKPWGTTFEPSVVSDTGSRAFRTIRETIAEVFPASVSAPFLVLAYTDSRRYERVADNIYRFAPMVMRPEDLTLSHGVDERIGVRSYADCIRFYARLIEKVSRP